MEIQETQNRIRDRLAYLSAVVTGASAMGQTDIHRLSEAIICPVLKLVLDLPGLRNLNREERDFPGIDLGDPSAGVGIQVTARATASKIRETIRTCIRQHTYRTYPHLRFFVLTKKQSAYRLDLDGDLDGKLRFDPQADVLDYTDILSAVSTLGGPELYSVDKALHVDLGSRSTPSLSNTDLFSVLRATGVDLSRPSNDSPETIRALILEWILSRTEHFEILGAPAPLPTDRAWLPLKALVHGGQVETESSAEEALAAYRAIGQQSKGKFDDRIEARTIGTFRKLCVVMGGPGSGKSLLLDVLAREFAKDSLVSLRVGLRDLARRMQRDGCTVEEGIFALGLDGSGIAPAQLHDLSLSDLVILCDGLDECGHRQSTIASGLRNLAESRPSYRVVVTTRPIGYNTKEFRSWRHYELLPLATEDMPEHLGILLRFAQGNNGATQESLREPIQTYLREGDSARILAHSPLLLALGASLFLRWQHPCRSKSDVYARIFKLIDDLPSHRKEIPETPVKAVRDRVLNELGWQVVASPLLDSADIEDRCAKSLQVAMGAPYLQARSDVQHSINYWEATGLLERLSHASLDLIAFVHKTCGEFAAARHLTGIGPDRARTLIRHELANPDSDGILDFATETPLATILAQNLIAELEIDEPRLDNADRLLRLLARPETSLSSTERRSVLKRLFALIRSGNRERAYQAGRCLTRNNLRRLPEAEDMAFDLLTAPAEWSRLVGWAVLCKHFPSRVEQLSLEDVFYGFLRRCRDEDFFVLVPDSRFFPIRERSVFEEFLVGASRYLIAGTSVDYHDRVVTAIADIRDVLSAGFVSRFDAMLRELGSKDSLRQRLWSDRPFTSGDFEGIFEGAQRTASVLSGVVSSAFLEEHSGPPPATGLKFLSAFLRMSDMLDSPAGDIYALSSGDVLIAEIHALIRAIASVFGLPSERLAAEATHAVHAIETLIVDDDPSSALALFPVVDTREVRWERAADTHIDVGFLEPLIHHRSGWVSRLATILLDAQLDDVRRAQVCERILTNGKGDALHWGAALSFGLPPHRGRDLILRRLKGPSVEGLHYLFDLLRRKEVKLVRAYFPILERGLFDSDATTAVSAARWCRAVAKPSDATWLVRPLVRAMDHWHKHEDPYPIGVGLVPHSPRQDLVRALCGFDYFDLRQLVTLSNDDRRDVSDSAIDCLVANAAESPDQRKKLVDMICTKRFSAEVCDRLLAARVPYTAEDLLRLSTLRDDSDPAVRVSVVRRVFTHPEMDTAEAASAAASMKRDQNGNVRDAVYRFVGSTERSA